MGELCFGVPDAAVEAPAMDPEASCVVTRRVPTKQELEEKKLRAQKYLDEKRVLMFLDTMLHEMFQEMPEDPIDFGLAYLIRHESMHEIQKRAPDRRKSHRGFPDEARKWSAEWKVPFLLDDLLTDMLAEEPPEPDRFAAAWFRWNKKKFMVRHHNDAKVPKKLAETWQPIGGI
eukprot:TRINITY_DN48357_c0_g1_i1.p2 TRINITY_DN48357_c0_g1~~TRINITY_DN48357_c0_g1_i1.p2  ORF type:complete len:174 (+),score=63.48 TRINITY_DN48357_c0_g1_i1:63-584(+)